MSKNIEGSLSGANLRIAIVVARFNAFVTEPLLAGCIDGLKRHGVADDAITVVRVPGSFEIPLAAKRLASSGGYDAVVCLGAVIRGATPHFDYVCAECAKGVANVANESGVPTIFGVITTDTLEQALERAGVKNGNKGWDAALAAIEMGNLVKEIDAHHQASK